MGFNANVSAWPTSRLKTTLANLGQSTSFDRAAMVEALRVFNIQSNLSNDETSTDTQMLQYLQNELDLSQDHARQWLALRDHYLSAMDCVILPPYLKELAHV